MATAMGYFYRARTDYERWGATVKVMAIATVLHQLEEFVGPTSGLTCLFHKRSAAYL